MEDILIPIVAIASIFVVLPWIFFHYVTQWKKSRSLSVEDENLMDELYELARRLSDRVDTVERLVAADNPGFRPGLSRSEPEYTALGDERSAERDDELSLRRTRFDRR